MEERPERIVRGVQIRESVMACTNRPSSLSVRVVCWMTPASSVILDSSAARAAAVAEVSGVALAGVSSKSSPSNAVIRADNSARDNRLGVVPAFKYRSCTCDVDLAPAFGNSRIAGEVPSGGWCVPGGVLFMTNRSERPPPSSWIAGGGRVSAGWTSLPSDVETEEWCSNTGDDLGLCDVKLRLAILGETAVMDRLHTGGAITCPITAPAAS